jgi:hypothetical protein
MKALPPVTVKQSRKIIVGLGYKKMMPSNDVLARRAVIFTANQPQHDLPSEPEFKAVSGRLIDELGNELIINPRCDLTVKHAASGFVVADDAGQQIAGPFATEERAWAWIKMPDMKDRTPERPPMALRISLPWPEHAFGHPRYEKPTTWRHLLQNLTAEFHGMMGRTFGKHVTARFLEKMIPLVTGETPPFGTIKRELYHQAREGAPRRERIHP